MRKLQFNQKLIQSYYENQFAEDLQRYFDIEPGKDGINWILHMDARFNHNRVINGEPAWHYHLLRLHEKDFSTKSSDEYSTEKNFIFAGLYYFVILVPQTLLKVFGRETENYFYKCTGWPFSSAGLGGQLPPSQMLREASLMPCDAEKENYRTMLSSVSEFMIEECRAFFSGNAANINQNAYQQLIMTVKPKLNDLLDEITKTAKAFEDSI